MKFLYFYKNIEIFKSWNLNMLINQVNQSVTAKAI